MDPRRLLRLSTAGLVTAVLLVSGCSSGDEPGGASPTSGAPTELTKYYGQKIDWRGCDVPGFQCATLRAPLDYDKPDGAEIELAVARKKATGPGKRLGSLQVNPGGPGGSAIDYLHGYAGIGYPAPVRARYDMVAIDPRGVARSEPVECLTGEEMDAYTQVDQTPDDAAETARLAASFRKLAEGCGKRAAETLPHVSTVEAARDMDIFRSALGDPKLAYVGASYGTFLGATYAELFPTRVGRLVLDGAMDPSLPAVEMNRDQTAGFDTAFTAFAEDCVTHPDCPLGTVSADDASARMRSFFDTLDTAPVPAGDPRELGESLATFGVINAMYDESGWPGLRESLSSAMEGDGSGLLALADSYYEREDDGSYTNLMYANAAVNCLDLPPAFTTPAEVERAVPSFEEASPVFGRTLAWASLNCAYWPTEPTGTPHRIEAKGAPPSSSWAPPATRRPPTSGPAPSRTNSPPASS